MLNKNFNAIINYFCLLEKLECGIQSLRANGGTQDLNKMAEPGDWPWHVALFKEGVHVCDATLVADNWLLTTAYCFQG